MDKEYLRRFFGYQRQRIIELEAAVAACQEERDEMESIRARRATRARQDEAYRQEEADRERWYREDQEARRRSALQELDRALSYGDEYSIRRARERLG